AGGSGRRSTRTRRLRPSCTGRPTRSEERRVGKECTSPWVRSSYKIRLLSCTRPLPRPSFPEQSKPCLTEDVPRLDQAGRESLVEMPRWLVHPDRSCKALCLCFFFKQKTAYDIST